MDFITYSHRNADALLSKQEFNEEWLEVAGIIESISDNDIINTHQLRFTKNKSISKAINFLLADRFVALGWKQEARIFHDGEYDNKCFRLDFAKQMFSIEVAFNHGEAIAWNLLKPVLASELNHVQKDINTSVGIMIMATEEMKSVCGFDGAVGTYEKAIRYLKPLQNQLSCPLILIGLNAPKSFSVEHEKVDGKKRANFILKGSL
ncbi:MAG: BglII/BstYI family type II restriction endonuclease [Planctomycetota bacterium]|nr:BglII/BstYI family type II restriction endonuclease [Planctomycetota bacterium]